MKNKKVLAIVAFVVTAVVITITSEWVSSRKNNLEQKSSLERSIELKEEKDKFLAPRENGNYKGWSDSEIKELKQALIKDGAVITKCNEYNINVELFVGCYVDKIVYRFAKKDVLYVEKPSPYVEKELLKYGDDCVLDLMDE